MGVYEKVIEIDKYFQPTNWSGMGTADEDQDWDLYLQLTQYKWKNGGVNNMIGYSRNRAVSGSKIDAWLLNPAAMMDFGPFSIHGELRYLNGQMTTVGANDIELKGLAYFIEGDFNYGPGTIGAWYLWTQGDDDGLADGELSNRVTSGTEFLPLLVVYDEGLSVGTLTDTSNHWTLGLWWEHSVTENLMLNGAFGYIKIDEVPDGWDDVYGSEFDVGMSYGLMANLTYNAKFGYFMPGDWWKAGVAGVDQPNAAWIFKHEVVMTF